MEHVTIRDIARICKVGVSTVSRAINNHPDINPETKKLILDTIREYNYVPNNSAQNLKRTETNTIALVTKGVGNPLFAEMIEITQRHVKGKDYAFVLQQVEEEENEIMAAIRIARERRLKGIIFMGGASQPDVSLLKALTIPYVFCTVDSRIPESLSGWGIVAIDNEAESSTRRRAIRLWIISAPKGTGELRFSRLTRMTPASENSAWTDTGGR